MINARNMSVRQCLWKQIHELVSCTVGSEELSCTCLRFSRKTVQQVWCTSHWILFGDDFSLVALLVFCKCVDMRLVGLVYIVIWWYHGQEHGWLYECLVSFWCLYKGHCLTHCIFFHQCHLLGWYCYTIFSPLVFLLVAFLVHGDVCHSFCIVVCYVDVAWYYRLVIV